MTTEQWERENQDTLMEYFIDGDPSVRRIQCEYCRKIIYTQTRNRKYCSFQTCGHKMLNLRKSIFHGIIYCATCGKSMQARYEKVGRKDIDRTTKKKREPIDKAFFTCQTYNRIGCKVCSSHKIEARDLHELVLNDIQELAAQAMKDSDAFYQRLSRRMENQYRTDTSEVRAEIRRLEERNQEIDDVFLNLYTDKSKGIISEQRFLKLTDAMEQEQNSNKTRLSELNLLLHQSDEQESDVHAFIEEIRKYAAIKELDEVVLNRLIKKIMIGEVQKVDGQKIQEVKIIYNFVGEISA